MPQKQSHRHSIAIILPAFNESAVIGSLLDLLPRELTLNNCHYLVHIIVVNDGSSDDTASVVSKRKDVYLINHLLNSGAGAATRTGINFAKELGVSYAVSMDSDGQHAVEDVIKVLKEIADNNADFIIGSRLVESTGMPWYRVVGNKGLSLITYMIFGVFVKDSQSGLRGYNQTALQKIEFHSNQYAFCSEMIWSAHRQKLRIKEVPITAIYTDYSLGKGQTNWGAIQIIRQIIKRRLLHIFHG
jgi:glycosyltransferase involved in cell wall biosynthesis